MSQLLHTLRRTRLQSIALCTSMLIVSGCGETEQITRYAAPKEAEVSTPVAPATSPGGAWFLTTTGPAEAVATIEDEFRSLAASTTIRGDRPEWTLPEGWSEQPGSGMRFATLTVDTTDPPLDVSVIRLSYGEERNAYLLDNVNRWRGQLGLEAVSGPDWLREAEAAGELQPIDSDSQDVTLVDLRGQTEKYDDARLLSAVVLPRSSDVPSSRSPAGSQTPVASSKPTAALTYDAPEQWQPGRQSSMRVASFQVTEGDQQVEISVMPLAGGTDVLANVNLVRESTGLEPWTGEQLTDAAQALTVDGETASYVRLEGAEQTVLVAILPQDQQSWFFKLIGDPDLAEREEPRFKAFVESVRIK